MFVIKWALVVLDNQCNIAHSQNILCADISDMQATCNIHFEDESKGNCEATIWRTSLLLILHTVTGTSDYSE